MIIHFLMKILRLSLIATENDDYFENITEMIKNFAQDYVESFVNDD